MVVATQTKSVHNPIIIAQSHFFSLERDNEPLIIKRRNDVEERIKKISNLRAFFTIAQETNSGTLLPRSTLTHIEEGKFIRIWLFAEISAVYIFRNVSKEINSNRDYAMLHQAPLKVFPIAKTQRHCF